MNDRITRRDFLDGMACVIAAGAAPRLALALPDASSYPPARTGYGGSGPQDYMRTTCGRRGRRRAS